MAKADTVETILADLRNLDSKIGLIAQKLKTMEKNEEVIGRTLVALNGRVKKLEEQFASGGFGGGKQQAGDDLEKKFASKQEVQELRYVLNNINPLEFATISQVRELLKEKLGELKAAKKEGEDKSTATGGAASLFKRL